MGTRGKTSGTFCVAGFTFSKITNIELDFAHCIAPVRQRHLRLSVLHRHPPLTLVCCTNPLLVTSATHKNSSPLHSTLPNMKSSASNQSIRSNSKNQLSEVEHQRFRQNLTKHLHHSIKKSGILQEDETADFMRLVDTYARQESSVKWSNVKPPPPERLMQYDSLEEVPDDVELNHALLDRVVVCKLNGGLGTTMGCRGPKSCLEVDDDRTFLDLTVRQVETINIRYGVDVPLLLMNSFNTHDETRAYIRKYSEHNIRIHMFMQHCYPRISKDSLLPVATEAFSPDTKHLWYPPGHGDIYASLFRSGLLENLINQGKEYIFISNIDNLSATVDMKVLYHLMNQGKAIARLVLVPSKERLVVGGGRVVVVVCTCLNTCVHTWNML